MSEEISNEAKQLAADLDKAPTGEIIIQNLRPRGTLKGPQTSAECSNLPTSPLVFTDDQCESDDSSAVTNCPRQRHSISLHPISGGAVMPATKHTDQTVKLERMVRVLERRVRLQGAVPCKVAESGARALVFAGLARWTDRGTSIRLCGEWPSKAA